MGGNPGSNLETLQAAGLVRKAPLPAAYEAVVNELSTEEVDLLVSVKQRLDKADKTFGAPEREPGFQPAFTVWMIF